MKVGDLIFWRPNGTTSPGKPELGVIIDKEEDRIKVFEMGGEFDGPDWWDEQDWEILKEKPLTDDDRQDTLQE